MSLRRLPATILALLACGLVAALCSGCGSSSPASVIDPVAKAAETTAHSGGAQTAIDAKLTVAGAPSFSLTGGGDFNFTSQEGNLSFQVGGLPSELTQRFGKGSTLEMTELYKGGKIYIGSPLFEGKLPGGAKWLSLDLDQFVGAMGLEPSSLTSGGANPGQYLQYLASAGGHPKVVGHEAVRGTQTTRYAADIDLVKAAEASAGTQKAKAREVAEKLASELGSTTIPIEVWVDSHNLVRKMTMDFKITQSGEQLAMAMTIEYFNFGATPSFTVPASSETFDITPQALQSLTGAGL